MPRAVDVVIDHMYGADVADCVHTACPVTLGDIHTLAFAWCLPGLVKQLSAAWPILIAHANVETLGDIARRLKMVPAVRFKKKGPLLQVVDVDADSAAADGKGG